MESTIANSGFIVALANCLDKRHAEVQPIYLQYPKTLVLQLVLVEVAYLIGRNVGIPTVVRFLKGIPGSRFELIEATAQDIERIAQILERYVDSKVDFVDASVMVIAERLNITTVLTIDRRDFSLFRPLHCLNFTLLP